VSLTISQSFTLRQPALERDAATLVFKAVPAEVCANCGEAYVAEEISRQILAAAELAARSGVQVDVREFVGAVT
jgi:YgiT-type zinc finger domain-containing protein